MFGTSYAHLFRLGRHYMRIAIQVQGAFSDKSSCPDYDKPTFQNLVILTWVSSIRRERQFGKHSFGSYSRIVCLLIKVFSISFYPVKFHILYLVILIQMYLFFLSLNVSTNGPESDATQGYGKCFTGKLGLRNSLSGVLLLKNYIFQSFFSFTQIAYFWLCTKYSIIH